MKLGSIEPREPGPLRLACEAATVALVVAAFLWPFRLYGFDFVDEGTQLAQMERVAAGQRPYLDFETGYTPGYFALGAALLDASDGTLVGIRTFGVLWQSVLVAGLWATLRAWSGVRTATAVAFLYVAFLLPVSLRAGAPFNIPYPGWVAGPLALAVQVLVARVSARRCRWRSGLIAACGFAAGLAFSLKPNVGLLTLAGATLGLLPTWSLSSAVNRALAAGIRILAVLATGVLLAPGFGEGYGFALFAPVVLAAARARPLFEEGDPGWRHLVLLSGGFGCVVLPWLLPLAGELGAVGVLRSVLLLDGGVVAAYLLPFPAPALSTILLALGAIAAYLARGHARLLPWVVVVTLAGATILGFPAGPRLSAENAILWLGTIVLLLGLAEHDVHEEALRDRAVLLFLAIFALQLFPRPDSYHVSMGGPPLALGAGLVWRSYVRRWQAEQGGETSVVRWASTAALALTVLLAVVRAAPAWIPVATGSVVDVGLGPRAPVGMVEGFEDRHRSVVRLVAEIRSRTEHGEPIFAFPDAAALGYLAARPQPGYYLYFVPGRPDEAGERRAIADLKAAEPSLAITCPPRVEAFADAPVYFSRLGDEVARAYAPVADVDGCTVWARRSASE